MQRLEVALCVHMAHVCNMAGAVGRNAEVGKNMALRLPKCNVVSFPLVACVHNEIFSKKQRTVYRIHEESAISSLRNKYF